MATLERLHWMAATPHGFDLYTDHNNLVFIFDPLPILPDLSHSSVRKVLRWAVRLSICNYVCMHITGEDNVCADLLGRWSMSPTLRRIISVPALCSYEDADFVWPTTSELAERQENHIAMRPPATSISEGLWKFSNGAVWIPAEAEDLQLRLCIISHTSASGHRGQEATPGALEKKFRWPTLTSDVRTFVHSYIHCLLTTGGARVPRPYGPALHGTSPNALVQFDYVELGNSNTGEKYVLMRRDDHSSYVWLFRFNSTIAAIAAHALLDWCAAFGVPAGIMSDGPTHFRNEMVRLVTKSLRTPHHFTLPYCPSSNGAVERLGKAIIRVARSLLSELRLPPKQWPDLLPVFQSVLNQSPSPHRGIIAPITSFTGRAPTPPIESFLSSVSYKPISIPAAICERLASISSLHADVDRLHPLVENSLQHNRARVRAAAKRGEYANFTVGDYFLVAREEFHKNEKLCLRWRGPPRITKAISNYVFPVEDLLSGVLSESHATRLKYYHDASLDERVIMPHVLQFGTGMEVHRLLQLIEKPGGLFVKIRWRGLPPSEDTEEPLANIFEDKPVLLTKMLARNKTPPHLAERARRELALPEEKLSHAIQAPCAQAHTELHTCKDCESLRLEAWY